MENNRLKNQAIDITAKLDNVIDALMTEIEEKEQEIERLLAKIYDLEERLADFS